MNRIFNPKCVVVVGDSKRCNFEWLRTQQSTFQGKLYSVQVNPETIEGIKALGIENYTSILDVPEPVDLAIVTVPRTAAPQVLEDCIRKGVAGAHFFTSGFAETGTEEGIRLERVLAEEAAAANFHLIGPNCRGVFSPKVGLRQIWEQYSGLAGPVGLISQSGGHAMTFSREAHLQGVDLSKSVSFGNGIALDATNFLEYFGRDPEIKVIGMYLEGVKEGRRFLQVLRKVSLQKPVVIWKGGQTEDGGRAIASHTGALAVSQTLWEAAVRQSGGLQVTGLEGLIDTIKALLYLPPVKGDRVGVAGGAGGQSVAITDVLAEAGLRVPPLTQKSYDELATFFSLIGGSYRNPVDTDFGPNRKEIQRVLGILERDGNVDNLMLITRVGPLLFSPTLSEADIRAVLNVKSRATKPVVAILPYSTPEEMAEALYVTQRLQEGGIPVFPSMERGASALKKTLDYYRFKSGSGD